MSTSATESQRVARLRLLASSIAGRMVDVRAAETGDLAWTDGRTVFVDPDVSARQLLQSVTVQASLIAAGSLDRDVVRKLVNRPGLARRYLAIEVHRALAANEDRLPPSALALVSHHVGASVASPTDSLAIASTTSGKPYIPVVFGELRPRAVLSASDEPAAKSDSGLETQGVSRSAADVDDATESDRDRADDSVLQWFTDATGSGGALGRWLQRMLRFQREAGTGALGAEIPPRGRLVTGRPNAGQRGRAPAESADNDAAETSQRQWIYPEWDVRRHAYRRDWCTVSEETPPNNGVMSTVKYDAALRRPLARLGLGLEWCHRRPQGDDLDIDAAIEARVEMRAGVQVDDAVYLESLRRRHELAVLVLLDVSGSANEPSPAGGTVHDQQLAGATALVQTLSGLGNRVGVYGFYSKGRSAVRVVRIKRFDELTNARVLRRFDALEPGGFTRFGAVIRHGAAILDEKGRGSRRLLVVLSDGFAYDQGYEGRYGEADARRALAETRQRGIGCLCLSIGAGTGLTTLRQVFGSAAHGTIRRPAELADVVGPLLRDALTSAELEGGSARRASQVRQRSDAVRRSA
jgi:nitric oxide reductase NorD protein